MTIHVSWFLLSTLGLHRIWVVTCNGTQYYQIGVVEGLDVLMAKGLTKGSPLLFEHGLVGRGAAAN